MGNQPLNIAVRRDISLHHNSFIYFHVKRTIKSYSFCGFVLFEKIWLFVFLLSLNVKNSQRNFWISKLYNVTFYSLQSTTIFIYISINTISNFTYPAKLIPLYIKNPYKTHQHNAKCTKWKCRAKDYNERNQFKASRTNNNVT